MGGASHRTSPSRANPPRGGHARALTSTHCDGEYTRDSRRHLFWSLEARPKENGETGFPISPLRTHLRQAFVALAAGRGWLQPPRGPRVASGLRDPRSPPPSTGRVWSMRIDHSHRTPAPVSRQRSPSRERGAVLRRRRLLGTLQRPISSFRHREETLRSLYSARCSRLRVTPSFVARTICLAAVTSKRENQAPPVDWRDNED